MSEKSKLKIAFVAGVFPAASETFIIDQVADLIDRGHEVEIFPFKKWPATNISQRYFDYDMESLTHPLAVPENWLLRFLGAIPRALRILWYVGPIVLFRVFNIKKYGQAAWSLKLLYWTAPFVDHRFDLYHCHFGGVADDFLMIREILGITTKVVTTFYGYDVSSVPKKYGAQIYDRLKRESSLFFVMSQNMKERVVALGFNPEKVIVHPVSIDVESYPFCERAPEQSQQIDIVSVGRFVEKKGFDDLLRALAIAKKKTNKKFKCHIIGDGPLHDEIHGLADRLEIRDIIDFKGMMPIEKIIAFFQSMHFFVQPSKTAKNGDVE